MTAPDDDATGLTPRRLVLMAGGWSLLLVPWLVVGATLNAPLPLRVALVLVVLTYALHLSSAIGKTGARTRAEAVGIADERGWL